jgi:GAF domain-containing protein/anti-anti-sigma regulatory factor
MVEGKTQQAVDKSERLGHLYELALTVAGDPIEVFDHIVKIIAELFGVRAALVERIEEDRVIALSMYLDGKIMHGGVFDLAGMPCANVRDARSFCAYNAARERFPHDQFLQDNLIECYVGVPVVSSGGEVIAIINAMHDRPFHLTNDDRLFLEAMASRVRLELERFDQATEARAVRALLDISREVSRVREVDETLQIVVDRAREFLSVDIAAVATTDDDTGTTSWKATSGFKTDVYRTTKFAPGRGAAGRALTSRQTVVLEGIGIEAGLPADEFPISTAEGVRNSVGIPLMIGARAVGVLIAGYRSDKKFTESSIRFAEAIASQSAVAIENARLFTKLAAANQRLLEADQHKTEMIAELSTPIIPIWDGVLLAPIIGTLNAERAEAMTDALLQRMAGGGADVMILDITGVSNIDTDAAQHLHNTVSAVRVLGARCIITGIRGSVAQTLVHLGITLEDIETRRKLSDALQLALDIISSNRRSA